MTDSNFIEQIEAIESRQTILDDEQVVAAVEFEKDIKEYNTEKNRIVRTAIEKKLIEKYRTTLGFTSADIKALANASLVIESDDNDRVYTLKDLLELQNDLPGWLVPNLIGAGGGLYIVAGAPKAGKTLLFAYQLAYSVAFSGEFLGYPIKTGPVLIFECEESISKISRTFRSKGLSKFNEAILGAENEEKIVIKTDFSINSDLKKLEELVKQYRPSLVIFDSLRKITAHLDVSENSADFSKSLYLLQHTLNYLQVPGVIIHHLSKGAKERGIEGVSGSLSISGASDGVILLYREDSKDINTHSIELSTIPREGLPVHWIINRTKPSSGYWSYTITEDKGVDSEQLRMEWQILRFMSANPGTMYTRAELASHISVDAQSFVFSNAVNRLIDSLQIAEEQISANVFGVWINAGSPWANIANVQSTMSKEFEIAKSLVEAKTTEETQAITQGWSDDYKQKIWSMLGDEERLQILKMLKPAKFAVDTWVEEKETQEKHKIASFSFEPIEKIWLYQAEGGKEFKESDLQVSLEYAQIDFKEDF
jgi:hypothetical protein